MAFYRIPAILSQKIQVGNNRCLNDKNYLNENNMALIKVT